MKVDSTVFKTFPLLKTERLCLRDFNKNDIGFLYKIRSDKKISECMGVKSHCSISETEALMMEVETSYLKESAIWWVLCLKSKGTQIGYAGVWNISKENFRGELGYALKSDCFGNGYMTEALRVIIDFAFNKLKLHKLEANVDSDNMNSINLLKKLNFKQDVFLREDYLYNGTYRSSLIFSKLESENC